MSQELATLINDLAGVNLSNFVPPNKMNVSGAGSGKAAFVQTMAYCMLKYGDVARMGNILNHAFVIGVGSGFLTHGSNNGLDLRAKGRSRGDVRYGFYPNELCYWEESILQFTPQEADLIDYRLAMCCANVQGCIIQNCAPRDGDKMKIEDVFKFLCKRSSDWIVISLGKGVSFLIAAYQRDSKQLSVIRNYFDNPMWWSVEDFRATGFNTLVVYITDDVFDNDSVHDLLQSLPALVTNLVCYSVLPEIPVCFSAFSAKCCIVQQHLNSMIVPNIGASCAVLVIGPDVGAVANLFVAQGKCVFRI